MRRLFLIYVKTECKLCVTCVIFVLLDSMPCTEDADAIAQWQMRIEEGDGLMLAETGWQEMRDMGW